MRHHFLFIIMLFVLILPALAEDGDFFVYNTPSSMYFSFLVPRHTLEGDFDGLSSYGSGDSFLVVVPKVDPAFGWGICLGFKFRVASFMCTGLEFGWEESQHNATWNSKKLNLHYGDINMPDLKFHFFPEWRVQPYVLLGMNALLLDMDNGYQTSNSSAKANYSNIGLNTGVGTSIMVNNNISLTGGAIFRYNEFSSVGYKPGSDWENAKLRPSLVNGSINFVAGASVHLPIPD